MGNGEMSERNYARYKSSKEYTENSLVKRCERWRWAVAANRTTATSPPATPTATTTISKTPSTLQVLKESSCPCEPWDYAGEPEAVTRPEPEGCGFLAFEDMDLKHPESPYQEWYVLSACLFGLFMLTQVVLIYRKWQGNLTSQFMMFLSCCVRCLLSVAFRMCRMCRM